MYLRELYEELVKKYSNDVFRFAYRLSGNKEVAEDLVQETFYEAWRSISKLNDPASGKYWLLQILRYRYSHWLRYKKRYPSHVVNPDQLEGIAGEVYMDIGMLSIDEPLQKALDALEPSNKELFLFVFLEGMSCREVAQKMELPIGTVLSRIHRIRTFLREFIKRYSTESAENFEKWFKQGSSS